MGCPEEVYVLMFRGTPIVAHTRFEGASADKTTYSAQRQADMKVIGVRLVDDG